MDNLTHPPILTALPEAEAAGLARRVAGARGLTWREEEARGVSGFQADVTHHPGQEQVVWATLGKNEGLFGLFSAGRLLATGGPDLGAIIRVQPVSLPGLPQLALMVDDRYDERVGAYLLEERRRIYVWDGRGLREAFRGLLLAEQIQHARWQNPKAPAVWRLRRVTGDLSLKDGVLVHQVIEERLEAPGRPDSPMPPIAGFRLVDERTTSIRYAWNDRLRRFAPAAEGG